MELNVQPVPIPDPVSAYYWENAKDGQAHGARASRASTSASIRRGRPPRFPAVDQRAQSRSRSRSPVAARCISFTVLRQPFHPGFLDAVPLLIGLTELDDAPGVRILTNIVEADPDELSIGMPMEVVFEPRADMAIPQFRPVRTARDAGQGGRRRRRLLDRCTGPKGSTGGPGCRLRPARRSPTRVCGSAMSTRSSSTPATNSPTTSPRCSASKTWSSSAISALGSVGLGSVARGAHGGPCPAPARSLWWCVRSPGSGASSRRSRACRLRRASGSGICPTASSAG